MKLDLQHNHLDGTSTRLEENYVSCTICHKLFKGELYLLKHIQLKHPDLHETCALDKQIVSESENEMQDLDQSLTVSFSHGTSDNVNKINSTSTTQIITQETNGETDMESKCKSDHIMQDMGLTPRKSFSQDEPDKTTSIINNSKSSEIITPKKGADTEMEIKSESDSSELDIMGSLYEVKTEHEHVGGSTSKYDNQYMTAQTVTDGNYVTCNILELNVESEDRNNAWNINPNTIECSICGQCFERIAEYTHHLKECNKLLREQRYLAKHMK